MWQWEELKHAVLGVIVLCNKFQGDLHCKESCVTLDPKIKETTQTTNVSGL